jgi:hypothetical protein
MPTATPSRLYAASGCDVLAQYPNAHGQTQFHVGTYATPADAAAEAARANARQQHYELNHVSTERLARFFD